MTTKQRIQESLERFDEMFYHQETLDGTECEYLLNNKDGKCDCQLKNIREIFEQDLTKLAESVRGEERAHYKELEAGFDDLYRNQKGE